MHHLETVSGFHQTCTRLRKQAREGHSLGPQACLPKRPTLGDPKKGPVCGESRRHFHRRARTASCTLWPQPRQEPTKAPSLSQARDRVLLSDTITLVQFAPHVIQPTRPNSIFKDQRRVFNVKEIQHCRFTAYLVCNLEK